MSRDHHTPDDVYAKFVRDIERHQMIVVHADGIRRDVVFKQPDSFNMMFQINTWVGHLCYSGDMGCYVFTRLEDMFEFFRVEAPSRKPDFNYWAEKCIAVDRAGIREYSADLFRERVREHVRQARPDDTDLMKAVEEQVLSAADYSEHEARDAASEFEHDGFRFEDLWETDTSVFTFRFLWCCYAIRWAIQKFDARSA